MDIESTDTAHINSEICNKQVAFGRECNNENFHSRDDSKSFWHKTGALRMSTSYRVMFIKWTEIHAKKNRNWEGQKKLTDN